MSLGTIIDLDRQIAIHTAQISNEFKLTMADSIILMTARADDATLWNQEEHFKDIEGVHYEDKKTKRKSCCFFFGSAKPYPAFS